MFVTRVFFFGLFVFLRKKKKTQRWNPRHLAGDYKGINLLHIKTTFIVTVTTPLKTFKSVLPLMTSTLNIFLHSLTPTGSMAEPPSRGGGGWLRLWGASGSELMSGARRVGDEDVLPVCGLRRGADCTEDLPFGKKLNRWGYGLKAEKTVVPGLGDWIYLGEMKRRQAKSALIA